MAPELCVERKSLPDLRQSLASGRLYHQAQAMTAHYELPVLLIEFERDKAFALQVCLPWPGSAFGQLRTDASPQSWAGR